MTKHNKFITGRDLDTTRAELKGKVIGERNDKEQKRKREGDTTPEDIIHETTEESDKQLVENLSDQEKRDLRKKKGIDIAKYLAKGTIKVAVSGIKMVINGTIYIVKKILLLPKGGGIVVLGLLVAGVWLGSKAGCNGKGTGEIKVQKLKIGDIITPTDRTNDMLVTGNTYSYDKEIEVDNQSGKINIFGGTYGIGLGSLDDDKITAHMNADVESGYRFDKIMELPFDLVRKFDAKGNVIRQEVSVDDMPILDTLKTIFKEGTGITEDESFFTKMGLDDDELKEHLIDSLNKEKFNEIMKVHGENLNRNGDGFRRIAVKEMWKTLNSGTKLITKQDIQNLYLKITFANWLGKKYVYVTDGKNIMLLNENTISLSDGKKGGSIDIETSPDSYGQLFGKTYPKK